MSDSTWVDTDRLRAIVQDAHLSFLIGAGTSSGLFAPLGDIEDALTTVEASNEEAETRKLARASLQAVFFDEVIWPNAHLVESLGAHSVVTSYAVFAGTLSRLLVARRSTLLPKHVTLYTTNVDLAIELAFEGLGITLNDGFAGRFQPTFDPGSFGVIRERTSLRYSRRSQMPVVDLVKLHGSVGWRLPSSSASGEPKVIFDPDLEETRAVRVALDAVRGELLRINDATAIDVDELLRGARAAAAPVALARIVR